MNKHLTFAFILPKLYIDKIFNIMSMKHLTYFYLTFTYLIIKSQGAI